jgi:glycosyltransferase involved in cell wall biosynthesis
VIDASEILFMGIGKSPVLHYRCLLPAHTLGADWVGIRGTPPNVQVMTGLVKGNTALPRYDDYKLVILQQVAGLAWLKHIRDLQGRGIKVLWECDDYLHGVAKQKGHDYGKFYTKKRLTDYENCMRVCDGLICSTEYIGRRYAKFNPNVYVCKNGLDTARYALTRPERSTTNIVWAGATGHINAVVPWLNAILPVMRDHPETCFVSIGQPGLAQPINELLGPDRAIGVPFAPLEAYPAAMCLGDIALAPAGNSGWYRGKSDLRWLEAGALGIPIVADPVVYPEITDGVNGYQAVSPQVAADIVRMLIEDPEQRDKVGAAAREYVHKERSIDVAAQQWMEVASAVMGGYESMCALPRNQR